MAKTKFKGRLYSAIMTLIILGYILLINYASQRWFIRADITETSTYTLSPVTKTMLENLDDVVRIDLFFSENLPPAGKNLQRRVADLVSEFNRYSRGRLEIQWHDPTVSSDALSLAVAMGVPQVPLEGIDQDRLGAVYFYYGLAVTYRDKRESIPVIRSVSNLERDLFQAVMNVSRPTVPTLGIMKTDTITPIPDDVVERFGFQQSPYLTSVRYSALYEALLSSYHLREVNLFASGIPDDLTTLFIPGGADHIYTMETIKQLDQFVARGGNLVVFASILDMHLRRSADVTIKEVNLFPLLYHYGINVTPALLLDQECDFIGSEESPTRFRYPYFPVISGEQLNRSHPTTRDLAGVILQWASPLTIKSDLADGITVDTLLLSSKNSFLREPPIALAPDQNWDGIFRLARQRGDEFGPFILGATLRGEFTPLFEDSVDEEFRGEGSVTFIGSDAFVTPEGMGANNDLFVQNLADWLMGDTLGMNVRTRRVVDRRLQRPSTLEQRRAQELRLRLINIFISPIVLIVFGLVIYVRRKKIQKGVSDDKR